MLVVVSLATVAAAAFAAGAAANLGWWAARTWLAMLDRAVFRCPSCCRWSWAGLFPEGHHCKACNAEFPLYGRGHL